MSVRDRTKRRLRWFLVAVTLLGVAGAGGYVVRGRVLEKARRTPTALRA
jgi:hypothetical protein